MPHPATPSRRAVLRQTLHFSAAAAGLASVVRAAGPAAPPVAAPPAVPTPALHLLAVGDYGVKGKDIARQRAVAAAMRKFAAAAPPGARPAGVFLLGDNFYGGLSGKGVKSPRFREQVEEMYPAADFPGPLYACLGNHDYNDEKKRASVRAQLDYREANPDSRWTMPGRWYTFDLFTPRQAAPADAAPLANVIVLDTNLITNERGATSDDRRQQAKWLANQLARPRATPWRIVVAHHPVYSDGSHGDARAVHKELDALLRKHKIDLYLSGHDHDLQHVEVDGHPTSFVVSGAGGARARDVWSKAEQARMAEKAVAKARAATIDPTAVGVAVAARTAKVESDKLRHPRGPFWKPVYGFTHLALTPTTLTVRHFDANNVLLHTFTKTPTGKVTLG